MESLGETLNGAIRQDHIQRSGRASFYRRSSGNDARSERETVERRDAAIKRMIAMPPKPHSKMKVRKKKKAASSKTPSRSP